MAGEEQNTQQSSSVDVAAVIAAAMSASGGGSNSVYIGTTTKTVLPPSTIGKPGAKPQTITVPNILTVQQANSLYLTNPKVQSNWRSTMKKYGLETGNPLVERKAWETAVAGASDWYLTSNREAKITPEQYLQWWAGGAKKAPKIPSRSIYQYSPEQLDAKANEIAQDVAGRVITDADKSATWYKNLMSSLNEMVMQGTVTEPTKKVRNPKTGKMENVSIQRPEVTAESIAQKITGAIKEADPESVKRKQDLDIEKWFLSQRGRG
jgi:hypothetical protein